MTSETQNNTIEISIDLKSNSISGDILTDVDILLYNSSNQLIHKYTNEFKARVAQGLYRVRARAFGRSNEKLIEVNQLSKSFNIDVPRRATSIPDGYSIGSHEYYQSAFFDCRKELSVTGQIVNDYEQCLYLFVRMVNEDHARTSNRDAPVNLLKGCWLESDSGERQIEFSDDCVKSMPIGVSWYRMPLEPGFYRLFSKDNSGNVSWIPIHVYKPVGGDHIYHTEVTFIWREGLRLETAVMLTPRTYLSDYDYRLQLEQTDASLQSLAAGERSENITSKVVNRMLSDKFVNPLQGIIACHLMLMLAEPRINNIEHVLNNIENLVSSSPDIDVLRYIVNQYKGETQILPNLQALPLISHHFQHLGIRILNSKAKSLVSNFTSNSSFSVISTIDSQIADYLIYRDLKSPWIQTRPHKGSLFNNDIAKKLKTKALNWGRSFLGISPSIPTDKLELDLMKIPNWIIDALIPVRRQLENKNNKDSQPNFKELAREYELPEVLLSFAWDKLMLLEKAKEEFIEKIDFKKVIEVKRDKQAVKRIKRTHIGAQKSIQGTLAQKEDIRAAIDDMSEMDVVELIEAMEDKFGVSAAVAVAAVAGGDAEEQTEFDVVMTSFGEKKVAVIKAVRGATGLGLKEAKNLVEAAPIALKEGVQKAEAEELKKALEEAGAIVAIK